MRPLFLLHMKIGCGMILSIIGQTMKIDFPLNLQGIDVDNSPRKYFLTISALLSDNNAAQGAIKVQEAILKDINSAQSIVGSGIYKYPSDRIHFSIIDFVGLSSIMEIENEYREKRISHQNQIITVLNRIDKRIKDREVKFRFIYTGEENNPDKNPRTIAIQAYPSKDLRIFFDDLKSEFNKEKLLFPAEINKYGSDEDPRFSVNVARFFRKPLIGEYRSLDQNIGAFNKKCSDDGKPAFKMNLDRISFVISDNYLSNQNPFLHQIELI